MSRWLPIDSAPKDGTEVLVHECGDVVIAYCCNGRWLGPRDSYGDEDRMYPTEWMPIPAPPSDTDDLDAQLSPESLADVRAGRQVCRAIYTGLAEVASLESLKPKE